MEIDQHASASRLDDVKLCTICPELGKLHAAAVGPMKARVMVVYDHPASTEEIESGIIGQGRWSRYWDYLALQAGMDRDQMYWTALVKCRPSGEGLPDEAVQTCMETWFMREMLIVQPDVVVCCGKRVWHTLVPQADEMVEEGKSSYQHGSFLKVDGRLFIACWSPKVFVEDYKNLAPFIQIGNMISNYL